MAIAKTGLPYDYKEDAKQEISIVWLKYAPMLDKTESQILAYAYLIAQNEANRLRRDLCNAVRLPGNAFREKKNGDTYVQVGHLAAAVNFEDLGEVLASDAIRDSAEAEYDAMSEVEVEERMEFLSESETYQSLSKSQRQIVELVSKGHSILDIQEIMNVQESTVLRSIRNICAAAKS